MAGVLAEEQAFFLSSREEGCSGGAGWDSACTGSSCEICSSNTTRYFLQCVDQKLRYALLFHGWGDAIFRCSSFSSRNLSSCPFFQLSTTSTVGLEKEQKKKQNKELLLSLPSSSTSGASGGPWFIVGNIKNVSLNATCFHVKNTLWSTEIAVALYCCSNVAFLTSV